MPRPIPAPMNHERITRQKFNSRESELESRRGAQVLGGSGTEVPTAAKGSSKLFGTTPKATAGAKEEKEEEEGGWRRRRSNEHWYNDGTHLQATFSELLDMFKSRRVTFFEGRGPTRHRWCTRKSRSPKNKNEIKIKYQKSASYFGSKSLPALFVCADNFVRQLFVVEFRKIIIREIYSTCNKSTDTDLLALFAPNVFQSFPAAAVTAGRLI